MRIIQDKRYLNVAYDIHAGIFYRVKAQSSKFPYPTGTQSSELIRRLYPNEQQAISIQLQDYAKPSLKKASIVAWEMLNGAVLPEDHVVYHKNLDSADYRGYNIAAIPKKEHSVLKDAAENIQSVLKLIPHKTEAYAYNVRYKHNGKTMYKLFWDIITAKRFMRLVLIKSTKTMSKYLITD